MSNSDIKSLHPHNFYAQWAKETVDLTFKLEGGTMEGTTDDVVWTVDKGTVVTMPTPTRDGYTFQYWRGSKYYAGDEYTANEDHTFTAVWSKKSSSTTKKTTTKTSTKKAVKKTGATLTGDPQGFALWMMLLVVALATVLYAMRLRRRTR